MTALIEALRTPEERFVRLPNYTFRPHYLDDLKGYEGLRVHTVDERPAKPPLPRSPRLGECPHLAQSGRSSRTQQCPLLGVKRTLD